MQAAGVERSLTVRALLIGAIGSVIISSSSIYVALRLGALPWPTIFVAILSMAVLRTLGRTNNREINVAHTTMSAGAMVAGGFAFTVPAIWILNPQATFRFLPLAAIAVGGTVLGLCMTWLLRPQFIRSGGPPYPIGQAAYDTVVAGDAGGTRARMLFGSLGLSAGFTALRDLVPQVPVVLSSRRLAERGVDLSLWLSPLAAGIGFVIGPLYTLTWLGAAVVAYHLLVPLGTAIGWFADAGAAGAFRSTLGIGLLLGAGTGSALRSLVVRGGGQNASQTAGSAGAAGTRIGGIRLGQMAWWIPVVAASAALLLITVSDLRLASSATTLAGIVLVTYISAQLTGETGVNPMELLGILVMLVVRVWAPGASVEVVSVAAVVAVATGLTGDVMNDFRAGHLFGTEPRHQLVAETVGGLIGALITVVVFGALLASFGGVGTAELPAPQAGAVAALVGGITEPLAFWLGVGGGLAAAIAGLPALTIGLGVYLPFALSSIVAVGGVARIIADRLGGEAAANGQVIASGVLGGEAVTGVLIALIRLATG